MTLLAQFVGMLLLVGCVGAYFWPIAATVAVAALVWMAWRAFRSIEAFGRGCPARPGRGSAAGCGGQAGRSAAPVGVGRGRSRGVWRVSARSLIAPKLDHSRAALEMHCRRSIERRAVRVEWWPVHRLIACAARPCGVPAAMAEARLMTDQHLAGTKPVPVRASCRRVGDPLPGRGLQPLAQHNYKPKTVPRRHHRVRPRPYAHRAVRRRTCSTAGRHARESTTEPPRSVAARRRSCPGRARESLGPPTASRGRGFSRSPNFGCQQSGIHQSGQAVGDHS
jgi:hypothetical protein